MKKILVLLIFIFSFSLVGAQGINIIGVNNKMTNITMPLSTNTFIYEKDTKAWYLLNSDTIKPTPTWNLLNLIKHNYVTIISGSEPIITGDGQSQHFWNGLKAFAQVDYNGLANKPTIPAAQIPSDYTQTVTSAVDYIKHKPTIPIVTTPIRKPTITGNLTICNGGNTILDAGIYASYKWSTTSTARSITVSPTTNTAYILTVTDVDGREGSTSVTVTVNDAPYVTSVEYSPDTYCVPQNLIIIPTLTGTAGGIYTALPAQLIINQNSGAIDLRMDVPAIYLIKYTIPATSGCPEVYGSTFLNTTSAPTVSITGALYIPAGGSTTLTAVSSIAPYGDYLWSNSSTSSSISGISSGTYTVTVTDENECTSVSSAIVRTLPAGIGSEIDPVFVASAAHGITSGNITTWNTPEIANGTTIGQMSYWNGSSWGLIDTLYMRWNPKGSLYRSGGGGDVNGDGSINATDALWEGIFKTNLLQPRKHPNEFAAADLSGKGFLTTYDHALIIKEVTGLIPSIPRDTLSTLARSVYGDTYDIDEAGNTWIRHPVSGSKVKIDNLSLQLKDTIITYNVSTGEINWCTILRFPGLGTDHTHAAYGDHNHSGVYEPVISKSTGFAKWTGSAWSWDNSTYLTSYSETDPVFVASAAHGISSGNISTWNGLVSFPDFGTDHTHAAYGDHTHNTITNSNDESNNIERYMMWTVTPNVNSAIGISATFTYNPSLKRLSGLGALTLNNTAGWTTLGSSAPLLITGINGGSSVGQRQEIGFKTWNAFSSTHAVIGIITTSTDANELADLYFGTKTLASGSAPTEKMRLTATGILGIGTPTPATSSLLDVTSTTQGFLPPRMTTTQRTAISSPAEGLIVYDLTTHKLYVYDGTTWQAAW